MWGNGDWIDGLFVVIVGCPSEADAVEGAFDIVPWKTDIKELNDGSHFGDIVLEVGRVLCEAEDGDEFDESNSSAEAGKVGSDDEVVKVL